MGGMVFFLICSLFLFLPCGAFWNGGTVRNAKLVVVRCREDPLPRPRAFMKIIV